MRDGARVLARALLFFPPLPPGRGNAASALLCKRTDRHPNGPPMINPDRLTVKSAEALNEALATRDATAIRTSTTPTCCSPCSRRTRASSCPCSRSSASASPRCARRSSARSRATRSRATRSRRWRASSTQVLDRAEKEAKALGDEYVSTEHLLLALADAKGTETRGAAQRASARRARALLEALEAVRGTHSRHRPDAREPVPGAAALHARPHRARRARASSIR